MSPAPQPPAIEIEATKPARRQIRAATMEQDGTTILRERLVDGGLVGKAVGRIKPGAPASEKSEGIFRS